MIIDYIYIHQFKGIKNLELNFNPKLKFHFDLDQKQLNVEERDWHKIENFFGPQILGITGILGDNGVGKTSIFEFLMMGMGTSIYPFVLVSGNNVYFKNIQEILLSGAQPEFESVPIGWKVAESAENADELFDSFRSMYFSEDYRSPFVGSAEYSESAKKTNFSLRSKYNDINRKGNKESKVIPNLLEACYDKDFERVLTFLNWVDKQNSKSGAEIIDLPFDPKSIEFLELFLSRVKRGKSEDHNTVDSTIWSITLRISTVKSFDTSNANEKLAYFAEKLFGDLFGILFYDLLKKSESSILSVKGSVFDAYRGLANWIKKNSKGKTSDTIEILLEIIENVKELYPFYEDSKEIEDQPTENQDQVSPRIILPRNDFASLLKDLRRIQSDKLIIDYSWGLSSGELSFLNLLASIFVFGQRHDPSHDRLLLLLDEPTLSFHPTWQRNFVDYLVDIVPKILPEFKFQVIFASHSPLSAADLPKEHIQILRRNSDGGVDVEELDDDDDANTFGGNPFLLYHKVFGIEDSFFSGFGRRKLEEVFKPIMEGDKFSEKQALEMRNFAKMVGDPSVKSRLERLIDEKAPKDQP